MTRLGWVLVAVLVLALATMSVLYAQVRVQQESATQGTPGATQMAQVPRGGTSRWSEMSEAERAKMREQMMDRMLEQAGLTAKEKAAAKKTLKAKNEAREALATQLTALRRTANKANPTSKELQRALAAYGTALAQCRKKVEAADQTLKKQLSLKGQVRCLSLGILENGLGRMGGGRGPGAGGGARPRR